MNFALLKIKNYIAAFLEFIRSGIWEVDPAERNPISGFFIKQLRIVIIILKNFGRDKIQLQAAGLTYYTLLSVVPVVALVFAIAKGFGLEEALERQLKSSIGSQQDVVDQIMVFANRMIGSTEGGPLAVVGILVLLWTVMRLLASIETSFNDIWQIDRGRPWLRKFTEYFSLMLMAPILIVLAGSITVVIATEVEDLVAGIDLLQVVGPIIFFLVKLIPYTIIWGVFTFLYMIMPNTKVQFKSALVAGIIAGTAFQLVEWGYINFQVGMSRYNAIYGSFAALPLFLIWANLSWLITLIGAEVAYVNQNVEHLKGEMDKKNYSWTMTQFMALVICFKVVERFENGTPPMSIRHLASEMNMPFRQTAQVCNLLVRANILSEVDLHDEKENALQPAIGTDRLSIASILEALNNIGENYPHVESDRLSSALWKEFSALRTDLNQSDHNKLIKDLNITL